MRLLLLVLVASLSLVHTKSVVDIERTVAQVENILKQNSQLPRLTREEILQLLDDIRAEDAKSTSQSQEDITFLPPKHNDIENEINSDISPSDLKQNNPSEINSREKNFTINSKDDNTSNYESEHEETITSTIKQSPILETTTKKGKPALMVVLPYTQSDGSSLQELYTRPPRIRVLQDVELNTSTEKVNIAMSNNMLPKTQNNVLLSQKLNINSQIAESVQTIPELADLSAELKEFLDNHGIKGNAGPDDHFFLPIEGFKPLPPARVVDGSIELPEKILLTYDLISPGSESSALSQKDDMSALPPNNFLFEPLKPDYPFELDTSASNSKKSVLPLDLPAKSNYQANYKPIDYDSVKVIPLPNGPNPLNETLEAVNLESEQKKRQTANSTDSDSSISISVAIENPDVSTTNSELLVNNVTNSIDTSTASDNNTSTAITDTAKDSSSSNTDAGASIADLEDSFGGPAPSVPGDSQLPPQRKNGFYWMLDWNSFLEVGDGERKVNIRLEPKLGDPQMFLPINVP